jgi:hypothetical protein
VTQCPYTMTTYTEVLAEDDADRYEIATDRAVAPS